MPDRRRIGQIADALARDTAAFRAASPSLAPRRSSFWVDLLVALRRDSVSFSRRVTHPAAMDAELVGDRSWQTSRYVTLCVILIGEILVISQSLGVVISLPSLARDLGATAGSLPWIVNAYVMAFAGGVLLGGGLADAAGGRRVLVVGLAAFALASVTAGLASQASELILARALQGFAGGVVASVGLYLLSTLQFGGIERSRAFGLYRAVGGMSLVSGLLIGGVLTQEGNSGWSLAWPAIPATILIATSGRTVPPSGHAPVFVVPRALVAWLPWAGVTGALAYGLGRMGDAHQTALHLTAAVLGLATATVGGFFAFRGSSTRLAWLGAPGPYLVTFIANAPVAAAIFLLSFELQVGHGIDPIWLAVAAIPIGFAGSIGTSAGAHLAARIPSGPVVFASLLIMTGGLLWLALLPPGAGHPIFLITPVGVLAFGYTLSAHVLPLVVIGGAKPGRQGHAAAVLNAGHALASVVGLALASAVANAQAQDLLASGHSLAAATRGGARDGLLVCASMVALGAILAVPLIRYRSPSEAQDRAAIPEAAV